jgi:hypothetical protein
MVFVPSSLDTFWATVNVCGIHWRWQHFISSPAHIEGDDKRLMLRSQESEQSCEPINGAPPRSCVGLHRSVLHLASFLDLKSFRGPFSPLDVSNPSIYLVARHSTIPAVIFEALMNFNPRAAFLGEKLDHRALFNRMNKAVLAGPIR